MAAASVVGSFDSGIGVGDVSCGGGGGVGSIFRS